MQQELKSVHSHILTSWFPTTIPPLGKLVCGLYKGTHLCVPHKAPLASRAKSLTTPPGDFVELKDGNVSSPAHVPQTDLEGTWRQYVDGNLLGEFIVKSNRKTGQYEMSPINLSALSGGTNGISNIQYDGRTWSFHSDWGYKIGKFVLNKVNNDTFEGVVEGNQRNMWVRIGPTERP